MYFFKNGINNWLMALTKDAQSKYKSKSVELRNIITGIDECFDLYVLNDLAIPDQSIVITKRL
jgi:hypothetical protein